MKFNIRKIEQNDNAAIAAIIRSVIIEHGVPKIGSAYADPELDTLFSFYAEPRSVYFVAVIDGMVVGGAGIGPLKGASSDTCELQKMYLLEGCRGSGIGHALMTTCLEAANLFGYAQCYLETMPNMLAAQDLYSKSGFVLISAPMGETLHTACPVWMLKKLQNT